MLKKCCYGSIIQSGIEGFDSRSDSLSQLKLHLGGTREFQPYWCKLSYKIHVFFVSIEEFHGFYLSNHSALGCRKLQKYSNTDYNHRNI